MGKNTYKDEEDVITWSKKAKPSRINTMIKGMKKVGRGITALFSALFIPAVIAGALIAGSILMFAGVLAPFALGILTNVMIALSLAVVAYSAVNYVMNKFVNFLTNKLNIGLRPLTPSISILQNVFSLSAAGAVLGTGIGLAATGAWVPVVLPMALSIAVVALAAFSVGWLTRAFFKTMANTDFEPSMQLQERFALYRSSIKNYHLLDDNDKNNTNSLVSAPSANSNYRDLSDDENSNDDFFSSTKTSTTNGFSRYSEL